MSSSSRKKNKKVGGVPPAAGLRIGVQEEGDDKHPTWCLRHLQPDFNLGGLSDMHHRTTLAMVAKRSEMSWKQIKVASAKGLGREFIPQAQINPPVPVSFGNDRHVEVFQSSDIRIGGKTDGHVFYIYWIDSRHALYDG